MTARKIVAVFDTSEAARTARERLMEIGVPGDRITVTDQSSLGERKVETQNARGSFWAHVKEMFMPDHERHTYEESMRRGGCMLVATVDEDSTDEVIQCLESSGAVDLDSREAQWRSEGWQPTTERAAASAGPRAELSSSGASESERIPIVEERLLVGKREVSRGSVRVRSYIVEEPVHEEVSLREERVNVERRPVDEPTRPVVKGSADDLMQERTIELSETAEQAVVGKEARVTEQVVVSKDTRERVESIDDTVRKTKVQIEDGRQADRTAKGADAPPPGRV
jgi:uncharacterized protein (TIGR02271 family)